MASIRREIVVEARAEQVWAAVRDVGAPHKRLAPGFVVDTRLEGDARRLAWAVVGSPRLIHHNASLQVFAEGPGPAASSGSPTCFRTKPRP